MWSGKVYPTFEVGVGGGSAPTFKSWGGGKLHVCFFPAPFFLQKVLVEAEFLTWKQ